jgi:antirestriction protein
MNTLIESPRIYVACLASYNAGILHGEWIDICDDIDQTWNEIRAILGNSPEPDAEEWTIHDYEGFGNFRISEFESIEQIHEFAAFIEEHGELGTLLLAEYCGDLVTARNMAENYIGCYSSMADYAQELTEESVEIPESLKYYIDYESMARDMKCNGEIVEIEVSFREVHLFHNC